MGMGSLTPPPFRGRVGWTPWRSAIDSGLYDWIRECEYKMGKVPRLEKAKAEPYLSSSMGFWYTSDFTRVRKFL